VRLVVTSVPLELVEAFAAGVTLAGVSVHFASLGAPAHVKETAAEKPPKEVAVTEKLALDPAATLSDEGTIATEKSGVDELPVPESVTC